MKFEEKIKNRYLYKKGLNFFKFFYFIYQYLKSKKALKKRVFYSNWGIDMLADHHFRNKEKGIYIDVGCHQPLLNNNTLRLYERGWKGINIDLDFNTIDMFNFFRKRDLNILAAVSDKIEEKELYFYHNRSAVNTLSKEAGKNAKEVRIVKTTTLNHIIDNSEYKDTQIDYISIDVEGFELNVLKGLDLQKYKPKLVILEFINSSINEFHEQNVKDILESDLNKYMEKENYKLVNWLHDDLVYVPNYKSNN